MTEQKLNSYLSKLKKKVATDTPYGGKCEEYDANIDVTVCPSCGASRAKEDGLAYCAYCGYEFLTQKPTDGIYVQKEDA